MSKVLMIRHLPPTLSFQDKEQILRHFGAEKVWEVSKKRNYVFASFANIDQAKTSLIRLHQLEIAHRRLVVEYSLENEPSKLSKDDIEESSASTKLVKEFLRMLNAWNPSVDFYQSPGPHLAYKYPDLTSDIAINILYSLFTHKPLYVQTLHLMNKMSLETPFLENEKSLNYFIEKFRKYFVNDIPIPPESEESEISSDDNGQTKPNVPKLKKREHKLPKPSRKRPPLTLPAMSQPKVKKIAVNQADVFETSNIHEPKKISLIVHQDALQKPTEEPEVVGELGKFQKEEQPAQIEESASAPEQPTITRKELLKNRISYRDMKILPVYKNYHPGQPSMRLYIKNLVKTVGEQDVKRIYKLYVENLTEEEQIGFDVRVMQEGRMKGQAFVTFPSVRIAETALRETNGFLLKDKPMVVQFARVANKKRVE